MKVRALHEDADWRYYGEERGKLVTYIGSDSEYNVDGGEEVGVVYNENAALELMALHYTSSILRHNRRLLIGMLYKHKKYLYLDKVNFGDEGEVYSVYKNNEEDILRGIRELIRDHIIDISNLYKVRDITIYKF